MSMEKISLSGKSIDGKAVYKMVLLVGVEATETESMPLLIGSRTRQSNQRHQEINTPPHFMFLLHTS